jgi:hypothetical protein
MTSANSHRKNRKLSVKQMTTTNQPHQQIEDEKGDEPCSPCDDDCIVWFSQIQQPQPLQEQTNQNQLQLQQQLQQQNQQQNFMQQSRQDVEKELYNYLYKNLMPFDLPNSQSLGFHEDDQLLPDGLSNGIVKSTIQLALQAKQEYPWTRHVPKDIYFEYVGGFVNVNEARTNWRPLFKDVLEDILLRPLLLLLQSSHLDQDEILVEHVVREINQNMWDKFYTRQSQSIYFQSGQTPLIYDPMSVIVYGYASCTGLSIFLVNALRMAGIPARLAGTAAWNGKVENGNHSWVEFYGSDSQWHIMEAKPASGGGKDENLWDPCQWWFCNRDKIENTQFFAARLDRDASMGVSFPLAWDMNNNGIAGEDRTAFMRDLCSMC